MTEINRRMSRATVFAAAVTLLTVSTILQLTPRRPAAADPAASFADAPMGAAAAAGVTGGSGGEVRVVSNLESKGAGSLREAAEKPGPAIVVFAVSGRIALREPVSVASDLTVDGRGADVTIVGKGLMVDGASNIVVRNLRLRGSPDSDSNDDAIAVSGGAKGVWIDHMDLAGFKDGLIDVTQGATGVTLSWNKLAEHGKTMLLGSNVQEGTPELVDITVHHNLYLGTGERNPMVRQARVHVFNNVIQSWGYAAESGYGMRSDCGGIVLVEANIFRPASNPRAVTVRQENCDPTRLPALRLQDNDLGGAEVEQARPTTVTNVDRAPVVPEPVGPALLAKVQTGAGWQMVANPTPIPDPKTEMPKLPGDPPGPAPSPGAGFPIAPLVAGAALVFGVGLGIVMGTRRRRRL